MISLLTKYGAIMVLIFFFAFFVVVVLYLFVGSSRRLRIEEHKNIPLMDDRYEKDAE